MSFKAKAKVSKTVELTRNYCKILMFVPDIAKKARPGQFVQVGITDGNELLLKRPFSISQVNKGNIQILFQIVGEGTRLLAKKKPGDILDIIGPLGNGFDLKPATVNRTPLIIAGGIGVAPLVFLAESLIHRKPTTANRTPLVLIGAKDKSQLFCEKDFKKFGYDVKIATDNGSKGFKGKVTELLEKTLGLNPKTETCIYACGPKPMLKELSRIAGKYKIPAQISLEAHMACGIGACLGCVTNTIDGYKRVCKEGPVFNYKEIVW